MVTYPVSADLAYTHQRKRKGPGRGTRGLHGQGDRTTLPAKGGGCGSIALTQLHYSVPTELATVTCASGTSFLRFSFSGRITAIQGSPPEKVSNCNAARSASSMRSMGFLRALANPAPRAKCSPEPAATSCPGSPCM